MFGFFNYIAEVLKIILNLLNNKFKYILSFYAISNNCVNARFLSRFIARKFGQRYKFYELINPIRRELTYVCKYTRSSYKGYFYNKIYSKINYSKSLIHRKSVFR